MNLGAAGSTANVNLTSGTTGITSRTINSLRYQASLNNSLVMASSTSTLTLASGGLLETGPGGLTFTTGNLTSSGSELFMNIYGGWLVMHGNITDGTSSVTLEKTGGAPLTLAGTDSYSGGTIVDQGTLTLGGAAGAPGAYTVPAGGVTIDNGGTVTMLTNAGQIAPTNPVTMNESSTLNLTGSNTLAGLALNNNGGLSAPSVNLGTGGILTLSNRSITAYNDSYSADPGIYSGTLMLGGTFTVTTTGLAPIDLSISSSLTGGSLVKQGSGALALTSSQSTYAGGTVLAAGGLIIGASSIGNSSGPLGTGPLTIDGGTQIESINAAQSIANATTVNGSFAFGGAGPVNNLTLSGSTTIAAASVITVDPFVTATLAGPVSGHLGLTESGVGTLVLSNPGNSFTGGAVVDSGVLKFGASNVIPRTDSINLAAANAVLNLNGFNETAGSLLGNGLVENTMVGSPSTLTVGADNTNAVFNGVLVELGSINGGLNLVKLGTGTWTLGGQNGFVGSTTVAGGVLAISSDANLGAPASSVILAGGTLNTLGTFASRRSITLNAGANGIDVNGGTVFTESGPISGAGGWTVNGPGTLVLLGANSYTGSTILQNGLVEAAASTALGSGTLVFAGGEFGAMASFTSSQPILVSSSDAVFYVATGADLTEQGTLSGVSALTGVEKLGGGTLTLSGSNTYAGPTAISLGTIEVTSSNGLGNTSGVTVSNGAALDLRAALGNYSVTLTGSGVAGAGALLNGGGGAASLSGPVALDGDPVIGVTNVGASLTLSGIVSGTGNLTTTGSGTLVLAGNNSYTGPTAVTEGMLQVTSSNGLGGTSGVTVSNGAALDLRATPLGNYSVALTGSGIGGTGALLTGGTSAVSLSGPVQLSGNTVIGVTHSTATLTLNGVISGASNLATAGAGTLALANSGNTFGGAGYAIDLNAGTLRVGSDGALGSGSNTLVFNGGALQTTANITSARGVSILAANAPIAPAAGTSLDLTGVIGGSGALVMSGSGKMILQGNNNYLGGTAINNGTVDVYADANLGNGSGGVTIGAAGTLESGSSFSTARSITLGGTASAISVDSGVTLTQTGVIRSGGLLKEGSGVLVLGGNNSYGGATTVSVGTIEVISSNGLGGTSGVTVSGGAALDLRAAAGTSAVALTGGGIGGTGALLNGGTNAASLSGPVTFNGDTVIGVTNAAATLTLNGAVSGTANLTTVGNGTLVLNNPGNTFGGPGKTITLDAGTLSVGSDGALGDPNNTLTFNGGALSTTQTFASSRGMTLNETTNNIAVAGSTTLTWAGVISGTGGLAATGPGTLALEGTNTYSGGTYLDAGDVQVSASRNLGSVGGTLHFAGGSLEATGSFADTRNAVLGSGSNSVIVDSGATLTEGGTWSGSGNLTVSGAGTLALSASNTYGGGTTVSGGNLSIGADDNIGPGSLTLTAGSLSTTASFGMTHNVILNSGANVIDVAAGTSLGESGVLSGVGGFMLGGGGRLVLSASNSYSGGTEINNGTLTVYADSNLGNTSGGVTIDGAGTLESGSSFSTARSIALTGVASAIMVDPGVTLTQTGVMSGDGLLKSGSGTLVLAGANSYSGATDVTVGTVQVNSALGLGNTSGVTVNAGAALDLRAAVAANSVGLTGSGINGTGALLTGGTSAASLSGPVTLNGNTVIGVTNANGSLTLSGPISGLSNLTTVGAGTLVLTNSTNNFAGVIALNGGTLSVDSDGELGNAANTLTFNGGALQTTASFVSSRGISLAANAPISPAAGTSLDLNGAINGSGALVMSGSGELVLGGNNHYSGGTQINNGTVDVSADANLGNASGGVTIGAAGTLEGSGNFSTARSIVLGGTASAISVDSGDTITQTGVISGGGLLASGAGTLVLGGNNTYSGATVAPVGTIEVTSTGGLGSTSGVTVSAGAALDLRAALGNYAVAVTGSGTGGAGALLNGGAGVASLSGPVTLGGDTVIGVTNAGANLTLNGVVSGSANLTTVAPERWCWRTQARHLAARDMPSTWTPGR